MLKKVLIAVLLCPLLLACEEEEDSFSFPRSASQLNTNLDQAAVLFPDRAQFQRLNAGDTRACFYRSDVFLGSESAQELDCWGERLLGDYVGAINRGDSKVMALGAGHVCTTRNDFGGIGIGCDGANEFGQAETPESKTLQYQEDNDPSKWTNHWTFNAEMVAAGAEHSCLLDSYGVHCWGHNNEGQIDAPYMEGPVWIAAGGNTSCAIDQNQSLHCWGALGADQVPESLTQVSNVDVGHDFVCAVQNGDVICWGNTENWDEQPPDYVNVQHISAGYDHVCVLDETAVGQPLAYDCFGNDHAEESILNLPAGVLQNMAVLGSEIETIVAGKGFTCASMKYDGYTYRNESQHTAVECWGANEFGQSRAPRFLCLGFHTTASIDDLGAESDTGRASCPQYSL